MKHSLCGSLRLFIAVLTFWGLSMMASMRMSTSMAIVCMINHTAIHQEFPLEINIRNGSKKCDGMEAFQNESEAEILLTTHRDGEFEWDKKIQGYIHASLFWGYVITQLPGALMGHKFGGRIVTGVSLFISAICAILCPVAARIHFNLLIALRIVSGLAMGSTISQMYKLFSKWSPPNERSVLLGVSRSGLVLGNSMSLGVSAFFCQYGGWELIFYVFGGVTLLWFVIWMLVVTDDPGENRFIKQKELEYIVSTGHNSKKLLVIPWFSILTSKPVWSAIAVHVSNSWFILLFETNLPTFLNDQVEISRFWNGVISMTAYFFYWMGIILCGVVADAMITSKKFSIVTVRKMFTTLGVLIPCTLSLILAMVPSTCDNRIIQILLAGGCVAFSCFRTSGFSANFADIAPEFSGIIFAMSNTLSTIPGITIPIFIGYVTQNNLASEWSFVFYVTAGISIVGWFIYMMWGSGNVQSWAINESELTVTLNEEEKV